MDNSAVAGEWPCIIRGETQAEGKFMAKQSHKYQIHEQVKAGYELQYVGIQLSKKDLDENGIDHWKDHREDLKILERRSKIGERFKYQLGHQKSEQTHKDLFGYFKTF